jgi:death-on-curing protein
MSRAAVEAMQRELLAEHGGLEGLRDEGLLDSALARCRDRAGYEPAATVTDLSATLAFGLSRNHPFHDGNKRIALVASVTFAELNGLRIVASESEAYEAFMRLASGDWGEPELAAWFRDHAKTGRSRSTRGQ